MSELTALEPHPVRLGRRPRPVVVPSALGHAGEWVSERELERFARALCEDDGGAEAAALRLLARTGSPEAVQEGLLAAAARRLGAWWDEDRICLATVAIGMAGLQRLLWRLGRTGPAAAVPADQLRLLLAGVPGDAHSFGLNLLAEQLRRRGGRPTVLPCPRAHELERAVARGGFEAVGLSVGSDASLNALPALAARLREAAPRPFHLLAGGPLAAELRRRPKQGGVDEVVVEAAVERLSTLLFRGRRPDLSASAAAA